MKHKYPFCPYCGETFNKKSVTDSDHIINLASIVKANRTTLPQIKVHRKCHIKKNKVEKLAAPIMIFPGPGIPHNSAKYRELYDKAIIELKSIKKGRYLRELGMNMRKKSPLWRPSLAGNIITDIEWPKDMTKAFRGLVGYHVKAFYTLVHKRPLPNDVKIKILVTGDICDIGIFYYWNHLEIITGTPLTRGSFAYGDLKIKYGKLINDPDTTWWQFLYNDGCCVIAMTQSPTFEKKLRANPRVKFRGV